MIHNLFHWTVMIFLCHWPWLIHASSVDSICYFPNGDIAPTYQPCNSTVDGYASACCELSTSVCGTKGLCYGSNAYLYRGGCTDPSWKSAGCPPYCQNVAPTGFCFLVPCAQGVTTNEFCCWDSVNQPSCCEEKFTLWTNEHSNKAGIPFAPQLNSLDASSPSSKSPSISTPASIPSTMTPASSPSATISVSFTRQSSVEAPATTPRSSSSNLTAVGVGVGVPLGILLTVNLVYVLFRERKHRIRTEQLIQNAVTAAIEARGEGKTQYSGLPQELEYMRRNLEESDSRQVHEIQTHHIQRVT